MDEYISENYTSVSGDAITEIEQQEPKAPEPKPITKCKNCQRTIGNSPMAQKKFYCEHCLAAYLDGQYNAVTEMAKVCSKISKRQKNRKIPGYA